MLTPQEFIEKEFPGLGNDPLPNEVWLKKMAEYAILTNSKQELTHLLELGRDEKKVLLAATGGLYLDDSNDYYKALFQIVWILTKINPSEIDKNLIKSIYYLLSSIES